MGLCVRMIALAVAIATASAPTPVMAFPEEPPSLSHTRLLRRVMLTLEGRVPSPAQYQSVLDASDDAARDAIIADQIDTSLTSQSFYDTTFAWGMEMLRVGRYDHYESSGEYTASQGIWLEYCPQESLHANKLGILLITTSGGGACAAGDTSACYTGNGDHSDICDNPNAPTATVEPWWAPGTTVAVVGSASSFVTEVPDAENEGEMRDCGLARILLRNVFKDDNPDGSVEPRCGCGPNLVYCARRSHYPGGAASGPPDNPRGYDAFPNDPTGQRRAVMEEPARLFAHIVNNDRDLSDLVVGDYTMVNQGLQHMYVRAGRQDSANKSLDDSTWWANIGDPNAWREVVVETMNPHLLADRHYTFDPVTDPGTPIGIPAAGVLTTIGWMGSFERERPRAARALEVLTCRQFNPPPVDATFPPLGTDPATGGVCKHCHTVIDPAAIHFKRWEPGALRLGGVGPWVWSGWLSYDPARMRWDGAFVGDTWLTPISEADIEADPNARFIDYLPADHTLLGQTSDGTIGPLGFAKMIVASGEFDACMVRRFYERFGGVALDPARDAAYIKKLADGFVKSNRNARQLIRTILGEAAFRLGR